MYYHAGLFVGHDTKIEGQDGQLAEEFGELIAEVGGVEELGLMSVNVEALACGVSSYLEGRCDLVWSHSPYITAKADCCSCHGLSTL